MFQVVTLCAMIWSLPQIWPYYNAYIFPYWSSFLLPIVQISLMSSVYTTVVMSWERYVRICLVSKLGCDYFSAGRFKVYVGFIIIFPILFYIPKFFEVSLQISNLQVNKLNERMCLIADLVFPFLQKAKTKLTEQKEIQGPV